METKRKGLQRLTKSEAKINKIASLKQITPQDLNLLTRSEKRKLFDLLNDRINSSKGIERDQLFEKIELIAGLDMKNRLWDYNHQQITAAISNLIYDKGIMPRISDISDETGLSRQTIYKHLKEYINHPIYLEEVEQFKLMSSRILARIFQFALGGDMKAAKLYFNMVGGPFGGQASNNTFIQNQNNYIIINGIIFDQDALRYLNAEQLNTIESILKTALPQSGMNDVNSIENNKN